MNAYFLHKLFFLVFGTPKFRQLEENLSQQGSSYCTITSVWFDIVNVWLGLPEAAEDFTVYYCLRQNAYFTKSHCMLTHSENNEMLNGGNM